MKVAQLARTKLSTKGQLILPKSIRDARSWGPGTELTVEDTGKGILLRPVKPFPRTTLEDLKRFHYRGKPKTLAEMDAGIESEVKRRHERGGY